MRETCHGAERTGPYGTAYSSWRWRWKIALEDDFFMRASCTPTSISIPVMQGAWEFNLDVHLSLHWRALSLDRNGPRESASGTKSGGAPALYRQKTRRDIKPTTNAQKTEKIPRHGARVRGYAAELGVASWRACLLGCVRRCILSHVGKKPARCAPKVLHDGAHP
jgi:hypothetical protein